MELQQRLQQQADALAIELDNLNILPQMLRWYACYLRDYIKPEQKIDWSLDQLAALQQAYIDKLIRQGQEIDQTLFDLQRENR